MERSSTTPGGQPAAREIWVTSDGQHWRCLGQFAADADGVPYLEAGWGVWCGPHREANARPAGHARSGAPAWQRALTALRSARLLASAR